MGHFCIEDGFITNSLGSGTSISTYPTIRSLIRFLNARTLMVLKLFKLAIVVGPQNSTNGFRIRKHNYSTPNEDVDF